MKSRRLTMFFPKERWHQSVKLSCIASDEEFHQTSIKWFCSLTRWLIPCHYKHYKLPKDGWQSLMSHVWGRVKLSDLHKGHLRTLLWGTEHSAYLSGAQSCISNILKRFNHQNIASKNRPGEAGSTKRCRCSLANWKMTCWAPAFGYWSWPWWRFGLDGFGPDGTWLTWKLDESLVKTQRTAVAESGVANCRTAQMSWTGTFGIHERLWFSDFRDHFLQHHFSIHRSCSDLRWAVVFGPPKEAPSARFSDATPFHHRMTGASRFCLPACQNKAASRLTGCVVWKCMSSSGSLKQEWSGKFRIHPDRGSVGRL